MTRTAFCNKMASHLRTPSVEEQARCVRAGRVAGAIDLEEGTLTRDREVMQFMVLWMQDHGWTGGEIPDVYALAEEV